MRPAARISAAIEILKNLGQTRKPADRFLNEWARSNRYAGSKDRAEIFARVYSVLRRRAEIGWEMGRDDPRSLVLGSLKLDDGLGLEDASALFGGARFEPAPLSDEERAAWLAEPAAEKPDWVRGNYPEWLQPEMAVSLSDPVSEAQALAERAPLDLRVNRLKAQRDKVLEALAGENVQAIPTPLSPDGIRVAGRDRITGTDAYKKGWVEVQDEGSQLAALLAGAQPGQQVVDLCAGGGGKTLALAAVMENRGQIYAFDAAPGRLSAISERLRRANARNVQVAGDPKAAPVELKGKVHRVVLDVPCSGTGAWRRNPDAKWRLTPEALAKHMDAQDMLLRQGADLVGPGGRLVYITCSLLHCENGGRTESFLQSDDRFEALPVGQIWQQGVGTAVPSFLSADAANVTLSPLRSGTDGFFVCVMERVR